MYRSFRTSSVRLIATRALLAALLITALLSTDLSAQSAGSAGNRRPSPTPRAANGKPDLTGVYQPGNDIPGTWEEANAGSGLGGTGKNPNAPVLLASGDRTAANAAPPYQPWAAQKIRDEYNKRGVNDPAARCLPLGIPRIWSVSLFPVQLVQTPNAMVIVYEYMNIARIIPIVAKQVVGRSHRDDQGSTYMGDSVGYWDGDTFVVDVNQFNDGTWLVGTGTIHTDKLHVTERYHRVSRDRIDYTATMEDPGVLTGPWEWHQVLSLRQGTLPSEYVCGENNLDPDRYEQLKKAGAKIDRK